VRRLLMVGRTRYRLPLQEAERRRLAALDEVFDLRVIARAEGGSAREEGPLRLLASWGPLDGLDFYLRLPFVVAQELRRFRPDAVVVQGAHETALALLGRSLARASSPVVLDLHGDWRAPTRLYGSPLRRLLNPVADRVALWGLRQADAVRTVSAYTTSLVRALGREPSAEFPAYMDFAAFAERPPLPLPERPRALFVGVLERYKGVDVLAAAWRSAAERLPGATLHVVGRGSLADVVRRLADELPGRVEWDDGLTSPQVAQALDRATLLVLPSRSEGMGRVLVEAFCRGRPVVATRVGGIPDVVEDGAQGILVPPRDPDALAEALVRVLGDRALAEELGQGARAAAGRWIVSPQDFARRLEALVEAVCATARPA